MVTKLATISLTLIVALSMAATPAFAKNDNSNASFNKPTKDEIVYDIPDSGDNAHPSGNDRSVEHGRSLTQGNSHSDPDDDGRGPDRSNGGDDKQPNGAGGVDKADQDNNNGCGNDDDFEDDNEGWCGRKPKPTPVVCEPETPETPEKPKTPAVGTPTVVTPTPTVLTVNTLPVTGIETQTSFNWIYMALSLIGSGAALRYVTSKETYLTN
jgi:hypothetical protein